MLVAVAALAFALAHWVTGSVRALERATAELADGSLKAPPTTSQGPPELRRLANTFTRTATRPQHLLQVQRAFASEASHQLKTPLTALRLRLENFEPYLDPRAHDSLEEAVGEVERLGRMVHGLLALARLENSATAPDATDLDAVVADRAATWTAFAAEHYVDIAVTGDPAGRVWAFPGALEQVIDNLLSNALRVTPPGTAIALATRRTSDERSGARRAGDVELHVTCDRPGARHDRVGTGTHLRPVLAGRRLVPRGHRPRPAHRAPADPGRRRRRRPAGRTRRRPGRRGAAAPRGGTAHRHAPPRTLGPTGGMGLGVLTVASVRRRPQRSLRSTSRVISLGAKTRNGGPQKPVPRLV
ncbi:sensor histidine kinase [Streptomyces nigra]